MMKHVHGLPSNVNGISSGLRPDEASAVLGELQRQAEQRLIDACREFQDIAFEMEWRLSEWLALVDRRDNLFKQAARIGALPARFNTVARKRKGKTPRRAAWARLARRYGSQLDALERQIADGAAAIMTRNEEGRYLEQEIVLLQERVDRIAGTLARGSGRKARIARSEDETMAALARLALELSLEPDIADLDVLLGAFEAFETRRRKVS